MNSWISTKDKTPKPGQIVDVWRESDNKRYANYRYVKDFGGKEGNNFFNPVYSGVTCLRDVTHWRTLPAPPDKTEWIDVKHALPEEGIWVLGLIEHLGFLRHMVVYYSSDIWWNTSDPSGQDFIYEQNVLYWQSLPPVLEVIAQ